MTTHVHDVAYAAHVICANDANSSGCENRAMPGLVESASNHLRVAKRLAPRRGATLRERLGRLDDRFVFVVGSPRSGTTFLAAAIGSLPGFVDLGEVAPLKAAVPHLAGMEPHSAARRMEKILRVARRVGLVGAVRPVEQTPELAHLVGVIPLAYPKARIVHIVRDGRDVASSLLEKPWLRRDQVKLDDAGVAYGSYARFWVEPDRRREFETSSDARRAAWVWRRYVSAARASQVPLLEIRYEQLAADPSVVAEEIGHYLEAPGDALAAALGRVHSASVGRYRADLSGEQLSDVIDEAGDLLRELGYLA
ncbi:MAG TPA: sulfotransferase [Gaiellaceae bacterium]|nr:sulfotransferase [Gaiellaceae bacterium]